MNGFSSLMYFSWFFLSALILIAPLNTFASPSPDAGFRESPSQVWKVGERRWTIEEEDKYSQWVENQVTEDFFIRYEIPVDCADVPYALRWIYARIAHLPAAATVSEDHLTGHWSTDWGYLPTHEKWHKDRRFRAALMSMLSQTSTRSLPSDTYPIRIAADSVKAGTAFFSAESHAGIVQSIVTDGSTAHPIQTWEATSPPNLYKLNQKNFNVSNPESVSRSGLVKFRWPVERNGQWQYLTVTEHPYYSDEQYSASFISEYADYLESVARRLDPKVYDPRDRLNRLLSVLVRHLKNRINVVSGGHLTCRNGCCLEGSLAWNIYSTYSRDEYIAVMISHIKKIITQNHIDEEKVLGGLSETILRISPNRSVGAGQVFRNWEWVSSHPGDSIGDRWGLDKCGIISRRFKNAQDTVMFIREKYGSKNPSFAQRSILVQQALMDKMFEERKRSDCSD